MPVLDASRRPVPTDERLPPPVTLPDAERDRLLEIARVALAATVHGTGTDPQAAVLATLGAETVGEPRGAAFVTLWIGGRLRGCIGLLDDTMPLRRSVALAAVAAARDDWRFEPVAAIELPAIELEVSVLGPFTVLQGPRAFRLGVDGLLVARGGARGLLLPEVATRNRLDHEGMLAATCAKAGLPGEAWRWPGTRILAFQSLRFGGPVLAELAAREPRSSTTSPRPAAPR